MAGTTTKKLTTVLYTKYVRNTKNYFPTEPKKLSQYLFFPVVIFSGHNFIDKETCQKIQLIIFIFRNMKYGDTREHWPKKLTQYLFFPVIIFSNRNMINEEICQKTQLIILIFQNMKQGDIQEHWIILEAAQNTNHNTHKHNNHQDKPCHPTHNFHFSFLVKCEQIDVGLFSNNNEFIQSLAR